MKPIRRNLALLVFLVLATVVAAGCGGFDAGQRVAGEQEERDSESAPDQGKSAAEGERAQTENTAPDEGSNDPARKVYERLLAEFNADEVPDPTPPEESYESYQAEYGEDYSECAREVSGSGKTCEKPASLGDRELKQNINVELILDASGSMQGDAGGGETKMEAAKRVLTDFMGTLPEEANVALRVYGHIGSSDESDRERSCAASELIYPFQKLDTEKFQEAIESFQPRGWTPVAGSLAKAREDFEELNPETNSNFVYMVSDGKETCGGTPAAAAKQLAAEDIKAEVNIIGFDVDAEAARQLEEAAEGAGGSYQDAGNATELAEVFRDNYDWTKWTAYYNCVYNEAYKEYNETYNARYGNYNCVYNAAYREYNNIYNSAYRRYNNIYNGAYKVYNDIYNEAYAEEKYEKHKDYIIKQTRAWRDEKVKGARKERDYVVEQAQEKRDELIAASREKRDDVINKARADRDEAIESAREERDQKLED